MAEQNLPKLVKRLKGLPPAKRTAELVKLKDEYIFFDLVEEFEGLTGLEPNILEAAEKMNAEEFLEAYRGRLECAAILTDIKGKDYEVMKDRIAKEYAKSDNKEYFLFDLAELDEIEEAGLFRAIYAVAVEAGDKDFIEEYKEG